MTPLLIVDIPTSVVVFLTNDDDGLPALGVIFSDLLAGIKKEDDAFVDFPLTITNFTDLDNGYYEIDLEATDVDVLGSLYLSFSGASIKNTLLVARVVESATAPPQPSPGYTPQITTIFGYIYNSGGIPQEDVRVTARIVNQPALIHPVDQGILIKSEFLITTTDSTGLFTLDLITGATVEFSISEANYRRTVLIPSTTQNLFDIP